VLFVHSEDRTMSLYAVPAEGGPAEPLGVDMPVMFAPVFHPDGRRIAFIGGPSHVELWAFRNLVPAAQKQR
jgi:hypothetical protein